ncbi:MAG TPA: hypothetical protein VJV79_07665 [Polyangiaceae bacterium]|nr:hypothetical protein [Polyangiaceae bacterium]
MKLNLAWTGFSGGVLFVAACNTSILDPIGGGPSGGAGQSGEIGAGSSGGPSGSAGRTEDGAGSGGVSGEGGAGSGGASGESNPRGTGGPNGTAGKPDCGELVSAAENAIESNRACAQDSDCQLFEAMCLFKGRDSCGNFYGVSKTAHTAVKTAYAAYEACAGKCTTGNACLPSYIAQCSQGRCSNQPYPSACATIAAEVIADVEDQEACSLLVVVDSVSLAVVRHALSCGPRSVVDEAGARASANAAATLRGVGVGSGELLSGPAPSDVWLFRQIMGDFGHLSAVSATTGQTLLWLELNWDGTGGNPFQPTLAGVRGGSPPQALVPWRTTEIGSGCYVAPAIARRDWDVRADQSADPTATPEQAANRVLTSAIFHRISQHLPLSNLVTVHYGMSAVTTPPVSEYIVLVNATK